MTSTELIGRKVVLFRSGREIIATIERLDSTYPATCYTVTWKKADNPREEIPADCGGMYSIAHYTEVRSVLS